MPAAPVTPRTPSPVATQRVLHVINGEHYSGAERVQDLLALQLPQFGFEVGFACVKPDRFSEVRQAQHVHLFEMPMRGRFDLGCARRLAELIRAEDYALVHAHTPRSVLVGSLAAKWAGVPLVYHVHSPTGNDSTRRLQNWVNAKLEHWSIRHAAQLIAVSPSLKQLMEQQGFSPERVTYVPNGVPAIDLPPRQRPEQSWTLGIAALFRPRKGIEVLIESLAALRSRGVDVTLRAVGPFETPEYEREVKTLVKKLGVGDAIIWTGFTQDIAAELRQMDLFVLPSLFGEGLPMVVLEAMAAGLPVVASHVEGVPEAIRHREDGLLVEPASVSQLAMAIEELVVGDELDYETLSNNARERHGEFFSDRSMAANLAEVYQKILGY
ncbi:MAG: glycosyltransferase family 4 protein [Planctomycetes bacterium]|nr:glycosyltransferase family 4 protein [Planctomycetota bacterium]